MTTGCAAPPVRALRCPSSPVHAAGTGACMLSSGDRRRGPLLLGRETGLALEGVALVGGQGPDRCFDEGLTRWLDGDDPDETGVASRVRETFDQLAGLLTQVAMTAPGGAAAHS